jgi:plastocyanin
MAIQASTYFPHDITIDVDDSITWTSATAEPHTVTFLASGSLRRRIRFRHPLVAHTTPAAATTKLRSAAGSAGAGLRPGLQTDVHPAWRYTYVCVFHPFMTGTVNVQAAGTPYPQSQAAYDRQSHALQEQFVAQGEGLRDTALGLAVSDPTHGAVAASAGDGTATVMRFLPERLTVPLGTTVTWSNRDPMEPHTVTFGPEPQGPNAALTPLGLDDMA